MSSIEWTNKTWNPTVGCTRASSGCDKCYAVTMTHRLGEMARADREAGRSPGKKAHYEGLTMLNGRGDRHFNGTVRCVEEALDIPLKRRKPTMYFVNSMSDLFHKDVPFEFIDKVFAVMALCQQHTFQILTKRPERMAEYMESGNRGSTHYRVHDEASRMLTLGKDWKRLALFSGPGPKAQPDHAFLVRRYCQEHMTIGADGMPWPLRNVWLGTSCENQQAADERIPHLLRCPAAVRFLSCEPLLGEIDLSVDGLWETECPSCKDGCFRDPETNEPLCDRGDCGGKSGEVGIDWVIVGGESGNGARPCYVEWIESICDQCRAALVPVFIKQLGGHVVTEDEGWRLQWPEGAKFDFPMDEPYFSRVQLKDPKGGDMSEWFEDLRVREFPKAVAHV